MRVSVRFVAEFYFEGGDLTRQGDLVARMQEGARGHRMLQAAYPEGRKSEVPLSLPVRAGDLELTLYGRADGLWLEPDGGLFVEEIKTTLQPAAGVREDEYPAHWAQAQLYAAMYCALHPECPGAKVSLVYMNLAGDVNRFTRSYDPEGLDALMTRYLAPLGRWLSALDAHARMRLPTMQGLAFPFPEYRAGQREMAVNAYLALRDRKNLLCQAPTGIGKTAAALFPAIRALGEGLVDRVFYLTARTTGALAAGSALARMREGGLCLRSVQIQSKEKICPFPGQTCEDCPLARGYFDRRREALYESFFTDAFTPERILELSERHRLCPFELSLDLSETADVVICDYNYVFDPRVKLIRFFSGKSDAAILVDEAHNLPARARDMLSASLELSTFEELRRAVNRDSGRKHPLWKLLSWPINTLRALLATADAPCAREEAPKELVEAIAAFVTEAQHYLDQPAPWHGAFADCYFACVDFCATAGRYDGGYRTLLEPRGKKQLTVTLLCADPSGHIRETLSRVHGAVLFSATLTPMEFYRDLLGLSAEAGDAMLDLPSPFPPENLTVRLVNLPMRYRQREESIPALADELLRAVRGAPGNYIACFPSYAFMRQVFDELDSRHAGVRLHMQAPSMTEFSRMDFLAQFAPHPREPMLALIVLGGVFAEGIDLPGDLLTGAFIVGTGVPQINLLNDTLKAVYEARFGPGMGYRYAYFCPGVAKALQAAGRVIRTPTDKGLVELIDQRWLSRDHRALLPPHWRVEP